MAIQIPNPGTGNGATGDNEFVLWSKVKDNFSDQTHAANRLVGTATGNVMEVGAFGIGGVHPSFAADALTTSKDGFIAIAGDGKGVIPSMSQPYNAVSVKDGVGGTAIITPSSKLSIVQTKTAGYRFITYSAAGSLVLVCEILTTANTKLDTNGAYAPSSPTIDLYSDHIEPNDEASAMNPEFVRNGVGDYTVKNTTGFRNNDGWYIKIPNDKYGNPKVMANIKHLENGDINIKTYGRRFDFDAAGVVPDLDKPLDIPEGRWIDMRLNDLPQDDTQTEV